MTSLNLEAPAVRPRPYGQRVGNLTRFGETWLNLDEILAIDFEPEDGCGCEIMMRGDGLDGLDNCWHVCSEDAKCLRLYLTDFEAIAKRVDADEEPVAR
jgi:hypothetical protein